MRDPGRAEPRSEAWQVAWQWIDRAGLEVLRVRPEDGFLAESDVVVDFEDAATRVQYRLHYNASWNFRSGTIRSERAGEARSLEIRQTEEGVWTLDGVRRKDLNGCTDLDIMVTPFTNTPPLLRLDPAPGETARLRVAWVKLPNLSVSPVAQEYTRLDPEDPPRRYRYRNLESGFEGEVKLDERRLVTSYGSWRRLDMP